MWGYIREISDYSAYLREKFSKLGEPFTAVEIQAAAKLYNIPIVWK